MREEGGYRKCFKLREGIGWRRRRHQLKIPEFRKLDPTSGNALQIFFQLYRSTWWGIAAILWPVHIFNKNLKLRRNKQAKKKKEH